MVKIGLIKINAKRSPLDFAFWRSVNLVSQKVRDEISIMFAVLTFRYSFEYDKVLVSILI